MRKKPGLEKEVRAANTSPSVRQQLPAPAAARELLALGQAAAY